MAKKLTEVEVDLGKVEVTTKDDVCEVALLDATYTDAVEKHGLDMATVTKVSDFNTGYLNKVASLVTDEAGDMFVKDKGIKVINVSGKFGCNNGDKLNITLHREKEYPSAPGSSEKVKKPAVQISTTLEYAGMGKTARNRLRDNLMDKMANA